MPCYNSAMDDDSDASNDLLAQLRIQPAARRWLLRQRRATLACIAVALHIPTAAGRRHYRKDELIDRIMLADWQRAAAPHPRPQGIWRPRRPQ
ncbi:MAG TPA: hypothetical protein PKK15_04690 [Kouleothrix sp.]|nr:hypothetical protein [Kouleothrix sp.]